MSAFDSGTTDEDVLVIDLRAVLAANSGSAGDVSLRNGGQLMVPKQRQEVRVLGEVQDQTSHVYRWDMSRDDYIGQSGGLMRQAGVYNIAIAAAEARAAF
jgi:hypothetical protein